MLPFDHRARTKDDLSFPAVSEPASSPVDSDLARCGAGLEGSGTVGPFDGITIGNSKTATVLKPHTSTHSLEVSRSETPANSVFEDHATLRTSGPTLGGHDTVRPACPPEQSGSARGFAVAAHFDSRPRGVLHLFSGPKGRPDGLAAKLGEAGFECLEVDSGGIKGHADDIAVDAHYHILLRDAEAGLFHAVVAGIPCSTYSVARFRPGGAPPVRWKGVAGTEHYVDAIHGSADVPVGHETEAADADLLAERTFAIASAVVRAGGVFIVENPITRSDEQLAKKLRLGYRPRHASLWDILHTREFQAAHPSLQVHFPQCALGGAAQKWTTLLISDTLKALASLSDLTCSHTRREHRTGRDVRVAGGHYATAALAAYPPLLNQAIVDALVAWVATRADAPPAPLPPPSPPAPIPDFVCGEACERECTGRQFESCTVHAVHLDDGDAYYTVARLDGSLVETVASRLRRVAAPVVGSKRPHAALEAALLSPPLAHAAASTSLRRNEREGDAVLACEALPRVNVPPRSDWFDPPEVVAPPGPLTTDELIPGEVQRELRLHRKRVQEVYRRAAAPDGWRAARDLRPEPLVFSEEEALLPAGRGWQWVQGKDELWRPLTPSRWPADAPNSDLNIKAVLLLARAGRFGPDDKGFVDRFLLACMAHGYPAPALEAAAVIAYPHVGALKNMAAVHACVAKDRKHDGKGDARAWTVHGGELPQVWPMRADPINIVVRNGKPRMTIDKTMQLSMKYDSYNQAVDLDTFDPVEMVRVEQLCRAVAILRTANVGVRVWSFDLEAYFRKTGKQRADWWKSGLLLPDGYAFDRRIQFGQREAPVLTSRQSNFLMWAIRRELAVFDDDHPPAEDSLLAWRLLREALCADGGPAGPECVITALYFVMCFVDDVGAACVDDLLYDRQGAPVFGLWSEEHERYEPCGAGVSGAAHLRRPDMHYYLALRTIERCGHSAAPGKGVPPCLAMDLLGVHIDVGADERSLTELKCTTYKAAAQAVLDGPRVASGALSVPYADFNSLVHKLLHASSVVVLGRQHAHHCMAARRAENRLASPLVLVGEAAAAELRWWISQFEEPTRHCLPLASRLAFPFADFDHTLVCYSDAAREIDAPLTSGWGAWTVMGDDFYYIYGLWTPDELIAYSINVLELAAENMGTFTFLAQAKSEGRGITHSLDFVDNTAAEYSADRGKPRQASMRALVQQRFDALDASGVFSAVERITSLDNDWADALSRGEERAQDVVRWARAAGLRPKRLWPTHEWRDLSRLAPSGPAAQ